MKKTKTMRIAVLMLALTLLTCCFVGSTFAKYTSEATGSATVSVAKWEIEYNNGKLNATANDGVNNNNVEFPLISTIVDTVDGNADADVKTGMIAPGTKGAFTYTVENLSEVNATYAIQYTVTETVDLPVQFRVKVGDGEFGDWADTLANVDATAIPMESGSVTYTVEWMWDFDGDDTAIGVGAQTTEGEITVGIKITVTQVD